MKIINWLIDRWMQACPHEGQWVAADILEDSGKDVQVKYCRRCGAVRPSYSSEWRRPQPLWF